MKDRINEAAEAAEKFVKLYYDCIDSKQSSLQKLYMDTGSLIYNGNAYIGQDNIFKFIKELPTTKHETITMDAQPIISDGIEQKTIIIQVSGLVKIAAQKSRAFQQSFVLTAIGGSWKIVADTFRLQDGIRGEIKLS